jgi:hypothetical protein
LQQCLLNGSLLQRFPFTPANSLTHKFLALIEVRMLLEAIPSFGAPGCRIFADMRPELYRKE